MAGVGQDSVCSPAEQDCKISSSNNGSDSREVLDRGPVAAVTSIGAGTSGLGNNNLSDIDHDRMFSGPKNNSGSNTSDSSISSSTNANYCIGANESDCDVSGDGVGVVRSIRGPPEDDAGSSSHSEVRSSSPGLADADADVEDSPSGSEETGSESERGGTPSQGVMYAPNTIGFPPSRSSLTHNIPTGASFVNPARLGLSSQMGNPFAVKGLPTGNITSATASTSSNAESVSSILAPGRWGSPSQKVNVWSSRPIIRPSALGSSLGSSVSSSTSPFVNSTNTIGHNSMSGQSGGSNDIVPSSISTVSACILRPPKLATSFGASITAKSSESSTELTEGWNSTSSVVATSGNVGLISNAVEPSSTVQNENVNPVFVPLAKSKAEESSPSNNFESSSSTSNNLFQSSSSASTSSGTGTHSSGSAAILSSGATSSITPPHLDNPSTGAFVFGCNLYERISNSASSSKTEDTPTANGISTSVPSTSVGLFTSAMHENNINPAKTVGTTGSGTSSAEASASGLQSSAFVDFGDTHMDRKRKFDDTPVVTGEEDESNVIHIICRLFAFDGKNSTWIERGRGQLRLNDRVEANNELQSRLIIRTKGSLRVMLNTKVWAGMKVERPSEKSVRITALDNGQLRVFLIMATCNEVEMLHNALEWRVRTLRSSEEIKCNSFPVTNSAASGSTGIRMAETSEGEIHPYCTPGPLKGNTNDDESEDDDEENDDSPSKKKRVVEDTSVSSVSESSISEARETPAVNSRPIRPFIQINSHAMNQEEEDGLN